MGFSWPVICSFVATYGVGKLIWRGTTDVFLTDYAVGTG